MKHDEEMTFAEIYGIVAKEYLDTPTTALPFSVRVINRFMGTSTLPPKVLAVAQMHAQSALMRR